MNVKIEKSWKEILKEEFDKPYFEHIALHMKTEKSQGKIIYPPGNLSLMLLIQRLLRR